MTWRLRAIAAVVASVLVFAGAPFGAAVAESMDGDGETDGFVYLMRGGMNIFSLGLDDLAKKMKAEGLPSKVDGLGSWRPKTKRIIDLHQKGELDGPIVLMGHSWGANATLLMATELNEQGIPVDLIVNFDTLDKIPVPPNVKRVVNFYVGGGGIPVKGGPGFNGVIENVDTSEIDAGIFHLNIEKDERLHARALEETMDVFAVGSR